MTKSHATPHLNHFELRNAMVPLIMPLMSDDADTNASGIT